MKSILEFAKSLIRPNSDYDYEEYEYESEENTEDRSIYSSKNDDSSERHNRRPYVTSISSNVLSLHQSVDDMKVVVHMPTNYDEARIICDCLKKLVPVIVKLEALERSEAQRVVDFISGACYTLDGNVQDIKDDVFLITPSNIPIEETAKKVEKQTSNPNFMSKFNFK